MARKLKTVAIYGRKSRDDKDSLESQVNILIDYCNNNGWKYEVFQEEGSSSSEDWNRPELQRLLRLIEKFHFDAIVSIEQSRLSRKNGDWEKIQYILKEADCLFITPNRVYDFSKPEDEFVSDIMSVMAKQELTQTKARLKRGTVESAKKGRWMGKKSPIGYSYNKETKRLEPTDDAAIIKRIFELYVNGMSTKDIAYNFTFDNVITNARMIWSPSGISRLLNNIVYAGHSLYGRTNQKKVDGKRVTTKTKLDEQILVKNTHEPIIDEELWERVQNIKQDRLGRPIRLKLAKHKFSGLIRCGLCGNIHSFQNSHTNKLRINSCQTRHYSDDRNSYTLCENQGCNLEEFENEFHDKFEEYAKDLDKYISMIKKSEKKKTTSNEDEITSKTNQLKKIQQDIKRVQQGFIMEIFSEEEAQEQIKRFKQKQGELENQIEQLEQNEDSNLDYLDVVLNEIKRFIKGQDEMSEIEANTILNSYIDTILYVKKGKEIEIHVSWKELIGAKGVAI